MVAAINLHGDVTNKRVHVSKCQPIQRFMIAMWVSIVETGAVMTISIRSGGLSAQLTGQDPLDIFAEKDDLFFLRVVAAQLSFTCDGGGTAQSGAASERLRTDGVADQ